MVLALGGLMIMVGLAFKLSAVPFHFWCPDVFEGASAEVNAFLSVASKAAALALLVRVAIGFGYIPRRRADARPKSALLSVADEPATAIAADRCNGRGMPTVDRLASRGTSRRSIAHAQIAALAPAARLHLASCWPSWRPSPARSAIWRPTARRTSSGCWPIRRSPTPAT